VTAERCRAAIFAADPGRHECRLPFWPAAAGKLRALAAIMNGFAQALYLIRIGRK
jgi:hypothetical protein